MKEMLIILMGSFLLFFFLLYVWPTPYRYSEINDVLGTTAKIRIYRITGYTEKLGRDMVWSGADGYQGFIVNYYTRITTIITGVVSLSINVFIYLIASKIRRR